MKQNSQRHIPCYLFGTENDLGKFLKDETSNISINLWSEILALAAANRWYSSNTEVRHHLCDFLKHPTRQPVRCWMSSDPIQSQVSILIWTDEIASLVTYIACTLLPFLVCNESVEDDSSHLKISWNRINMKLPYQILACITLDKKLKFDSN